jgi:hypothetical protein
MLYAGLDLSRKRLDFHLLDDESATVEVGAAPPDADSLHGLTQRLERRARPARSAPRAPTAAATPATPRDRRRSHRACDRSARRAPPPHVETPAGMAFGTSASLAWLDSLSAGPDSPALSCPRNRGRSNDHSRLAYCEVLTSERKDACAASCSARVPGTRRRGSRSSACSRTMRRPTTRIPGEMPAASCGSSAATRDRTRHGRTGRPRR